MSFLYDDFSKSGISENTTYEYVRQGYLTENEDGWKLYYPGLYEDKKTSYYNKRLKNPTNSKYLKPKGETSKLFRPIKMSLKSALCHYYGR